jgi:D-serine deaminase-like pyridoxal phosphate-dependent protein
MRLENLDTPAVVVDLDILERNIRRMAEYAGKHNLRLRPHTKTHKIPAIARMQVAAGAAGVTVAKTGEAEVMVDAGLTDVMVAYPVLGEAKATKLAALARRTKISVSFDDFAVPEGLSRAAVAAGSTLHVLPDLDVGFGRTGVQTVDALVALAEKTAALPGLKLAGIFCYPGHIKEPPDKQGPAMTKVQEKLAEAVERFRARGLPVDTVSSGSTPSAFQSHLTPAANEIRPGTYVFNDLGYHSIGANALEDCAVTVLSTVVSSAAKDGQVILDGGTKTFTSDRCIQKFEGFGYVREYPEAVIEKCNEEHGWTNVAKCAKRPKVGERVSVIPNHVCVVINMHNRIYGVRKGVVEVEWPVAGRGLVQ